MDHFLPFKDAVAYSKEPNSTIRPISMSTIRRKIEPITKDPTHASRSLIQPSITEVARFKEEGKPFRWEVSLELLEWEFPKDKNAKSKQERAEESDGEHSSNRRGELDIAFLKKQLDVKDEQISTANATIMELNNRLHEGHVLIQGLQQQLQIGTPKNEPKDSGNKNDKRKKSHNKDVMEAEVVNDENEVTNRPTSPASNIRDTRKKKESGDRKSKENKIAQQKKKTIAKAAVKKAAKKKMKPAKKTKRFAWLHKKIW